MQRVLSQKDAILIACREALNEAFDTTELDKAATRLQDQALGMAERVRLLVDENARVQRGSGRVQGGLRGTARRTRKAQRENSGHCRTEKR